MKARHLASSVKAIKVPKTGSFYAIGSRYAILSGAALAKTEASSEGGTSRLGKTKKFSVSSVSLVPPLAGRVVNTLLCLLLIFLPLALPPLGLAQQEITLTPSISLSETYDDNIDLQNENKKSDYITTASPAIALGMESEQSHLALTYSPSFVWYSKNDDNNTVRHSGNVTYDRDVAEHLTFRLTDTYLKSEDPLEQTEGIETIRRTRNTYQRNSGEANMQYLFGKENTITAGYRQSLLINEDVTIDDRTTYEPFADLTYWFNIKQGFSVTHTYTIADFSSDQGIPSQPDYESHNPEMRYLHRFSPETSGYVAYRFTNTDFETEAREDYRVHDGSLGIEKQLSPQTSLSAGLGYFVQKRESTGDDSGYSYDALLTRTFEHGRFSLGGSGGWEEQSLEAEDRGFVKFLSARARVDYQFLDPLSGYAGATYRQDKDQNDINNNTLRGNCGLRWAFHRYLSLAIDYTYANRGSDNPLDEYDNNRVMLMLTGSRLYKW